MSSNWTGRPVFCCRIVARSFIVLHTAAYWIMHALRACIPATNPMARCEFTTLRLRLIKIGARVIEHAARIRVHLPTSCPERDLFAGIARRLVPPAPS